LVGMVGQTAPTNGLEPSQQTLCDVVRATMKEEHGIAKLQLYTLQ